MLHTLTRGAPVAIQCRFSRGIFSTERAFSITLADGSEYSGPAPAHYCWNSRGEVIGATEGVDKAITGKVAARFIEDREGYLVVEVPDGGCLAVNKDLVTERPRKAVLPNSEIEV